MASLFETRSFLNHKKYPKLSYLVLIMVGNKHKNGIICTFPNCNKPMRTQKFKMHFTRAHLKDGEVYSVEHRRQYEAAREESARSTVKNELVCVAAAPAMPPATSVAASEKNLFCVERAASATATSFRGNDQASQVKQSTPVQNQQAPFTSQAEGSTTKCDDNSTSRCPSALDHLPISGQSALSDGNVSGRKRSASAVENSAETVDPTSVLLMQLISLMDQRFQELVGKMGEMIDVQKDLIDTLQARNPYSHAPASAFSHAVDAATKRRKKDTSARNDNNDASSEDVNGSSDTTISADGPPTSGFVL